MMDHKSLNNTIKNHQDDIYKFMLRNVKDSQTAEDITQDVLLKFTEQHQKGETFHNQKNYLYTIAKNHLINYWKRAARDRSRQEEYWTAIQKNRTDQVIPCIDNDREVIFSQLKGQMTKQQSTIFLMNRKEGFSYNEIAGKLDISRSTVKNHMVAALKNIRQFMDIHADKLILWAMLGPVLM